MSGAQRCETGSTGEERLKNAVQRSRAQLASSDGGDTCARTCARTDM